MTPLLPRYICIHGHFYQPPRENAWTGEVERQESAAPYHDWNERITDECYRPNSVEQANNYGWISFNFGPTLMSWLERHAPETYAAVLAADRESAGRFGGHGSALAQVYNHMILPLANDRDRRTQVIWGRRDFEFRFGRRPRGMWLPETAADTASLEALAGDDIEFTVLAPAQARRSRPVGQAEWTAIDGHAIDPSRAYRCNLPSGRSIALFFYDGPISQAVAFESLLDNGDRFADRLLKGFDEARGHPQLVHIATDGETYGHHHRHGEQALTHALTALRQRDDVRLTNYAEFLQLHPADHEIEIVENSSWSCAHGIERWRSDCGCSTGDHPEWNQGWRAPLRSALDWLRTQLVEPFEQTTAAVLHDPWAARDEFVDLLLDPGAAMRSAFLDRHARPQSSTDQQTRALQLLELQRQAMLMFTSCGWFFDDLSRIETIQVLQYAARAVELARRHLDVDLRPGFLERLDLARSNAEDQGGGRQVFERAERAGRRAGA